jgi:DNA-binding IclR family transcriptional regulator
VAEGFQPVKSADRTLELLETLAAAAQRPTLGELALQLGIPKSSLHGVLRTMLARGWVQTDETGTRFGLGLRALQVGAAYIETDPMVAVLSPVLDDLAGRFGETVHLGRLEGADVVYLAKRESVHPLRLFSAIGRRLPAHATALGKALLAARRDDEALGQLSFPLRRLTQHTLTSRQRLLADLAATRERGYAIDREENSDGIVCLAVAVRRASSSHPTVDALSVSIPLSRLTTTLEKRIANALLAAAR